MSHLLLHFQHNDTTDIIRVICGFVGLCILIIVAFTFIRITQHLHCFPGPPSISSLQSKDERERIKIYSTFAVSFATICVIISFSAYPVCAQWSCWNTVLGDIYGLLIWNFYAVTKVFTYLLFFDRLLKPRYQRIYQYTDCTRVLLLGLLIALVIAVSILDMEYGLVFAGIAIHHSFELILLLMLVISDCALAISISVIFFHPLCSRSFKTHLMLQTSNVNVADLRKYGIITALQLIAAVVFQMSMLGRICFNIIGPSLTVWSVYLDIARVIQMMDCLLLMICIYFGFVRKQKNKSCCNMCRLFCIWCGCGCCRKYEFKQFVEVFEMDLNGKQPSKDKVTISAKLSDIPENTTVKISNTPDIQYLLGRQ